MEGKIFEVRINESRNQKGLSYVKEGNRNSMLIMTGMQEHASRYQAFAEFLNELGYNVHVLDAVGQGLNAPKVEDLQKWYVGAFDDNVKAANIKINELRKESDKVILFGHSMGSFMTQRYLELYPDTTDGVIICGTDGPNAGKMNMAYTLASIVVNKKNWDKPSKFLSNLAMGGYSKAVKERESDLDWLSYNKENVKKYEADEYSGHTNTNGFWKEFLKGMKTLYSKDEWNKISRKEHILIIAGEDDPVGQLGKGPRKLKETLDKMDVKDVKIVMFDKMRHEILNEDKKEDVYKVVEDFLK